MTFRWLVALVKPGGHLLPYIQYLHNIYRVCAVSRASGRVHLPPGLHMKTRCKLPHQKLLQLSVAMVLCCHGVAMGTPGSPVMRSHPDEPLMGNGRR